MALRRQGQRMDHGRGRLCLRRPALVPDHGLPPAQEAAHVVSRGHRLPDLPGPLRARRGLARARRDIAGHQAQGRPGPRDRGGLGRAGDLPQDRGRRHRQLGLLRRHPRGHPGEPRVPRGPGRHRALPQPHLRGREQPPLRHRGLPQDRPHAGRRAELPRALRRRRRARHLRHPGRRLQPLRGGLALLQPLWHLQGARRVAGRRLAVPRLVHF